MQNHYNLIYRVEEREMIPLCADQGVAVLPYSPLARGVLAAIDASLQRLGTDYVDLYQIHRWDYQTPVEETMEVLHEVVRAGKARYIGASSMFAWQFAKAQNLAERHGWTRFASMQNHYNLIYREEEREMIPLCLDQGVAVLPYSPLARGVLAGNRSRQGERRTARAGNDPLSDERYNSPGDFDVADRLTEVATARGVPPAAGRGQYHRSRFREAAPCGRKWRPLYHRRTSPMRHSKR